MPQCLRLTLSIAAVVVGLTCFGCSSRTKNTEGSAQSRLPIVQGLTNATATQIAIVAPSGLKLHFGYIVSDSPSMPTEGLMPANKPLLSTITSTNGSEFAVHHLEIGSLQIGTTYLLDVHDENGKRLDSRQFRTLDLHARPARVIVASCMSDAFLPTSRLMWKAVVDANPDLLLLIGDNVYAETAKGRPKSPLNEQELWIRYVETFQRLDLYRSQKLIPTLATWDDHDYGMGDGNRDNPFKLEAAKVLRAFFPQNGSPAFPEYSNGPGVSSKFDAFGYRFLLLDDRSFRTSKKMTNGDTAEQSHFGQEQEAWLFDGVKSSKTPVWLVSGDQWFGAYHRFESYEGSHPKSFRPFLKKLRDAKQTVMFISGDRHLSEVMRIEKSILGYETYEFTSSALHARMYPSGWDKYPNPRHVLGIAMEPNFTQFDLTPAAKDRSIQLKGASIGTESRVLYPFDFKIAR